MTTEMQTPALRALLRPDLRALTPYQPVEPAEVLAARLGLPPERIVKLDSNLNLAGPSPRVAAALAACDRYHDYPDPAQRRLRAALAEYTGVPAEGIVAGVGSDELIDLLARAVLAPGDTVLDLTPTFGMYPFTTAVCGGRTVPVPRRADFSIDTAAVARAVDERTKLLFVATPNNPTGNPATAEELEELLRLPVLVVVDEAYIEFSGGSMAAAVAHHPNLVVLRTFSKWAGLAGMRCGYGLMQPELATLLMTIKPPYNVSVAAEVAMLASLEDRDALLATVAAAVAERERLAAALAELPYLEPYPSAANFILCRVRGRSAPELRDRLRAQGVLVRHYDKPGVADCLRISVGLPEHTERLLAALHAAVA